MVGGGSGSGVAAKGRHHSSPGVSSAQPPRAQPMARAVKSCERSAEAFRVILPERIAVMLAISATWRSTRGNIRTRAEPESFAPASRRETFFARARTGKERAADDCSRREEPSTFGILRSGVAGNRGTCQGPDGLNPTLLNWLIWLPACVFFASALSQLAAPIGWRRHAALALALGSLCAPWFAPQGSVLRAFVALYLLWACTKVFDMTRDRERRSPLFRWIWMLVLHDLRRDGYARHGAKPELRPGLLVSALVALA